MEVRMVADLSNSCRAYGYIKSLGSVAELNVVAELRSGS